MKWIDRGLLYGIVFITGAAVLVVEILGTRVIGPFYGGTLFVWASLIVVTLGALAMGYIAGGVLADRYPQERWLYLIVLIAGMVLLVPMKIDRWLLPFTDQFGLRMGPLAAASGLFFIPLLLLGMVSPFAIRLTTVHAKKSGTSSGIVFALATLGSVIGGLLAGFYLLDDFSLSHIFLATSLVLVTLAVIGITKQARDHALGVAGLAALMVFALWQLPGSTYTDGYTFQILYQKEGWYGNVKVIEAGGTRCITVDGVTESCRKVHDNTVGPYFQELAAMVNEQAPQSMLVLGSGGGDLMDGGVSDEILVDLVDIDPDMVRLGREYLGFVPGENQTIVIDDARHFVQTTSKKYDLIVVDVATGVHPPYYMFSQEAFTLLKSHLSPQGLILIHALGGVGSNDASIASIMKTARSVFPAVEATATNPEENVSYLIHVSPDTDYTISHEVLYGVHFIPVAVPEEKGLVLTDDYNTFDLLYAQKYPVLVGATRNFAGFNALFSL